MKKYFFYVIAAIAATGCHDYKADCDVLTKQKDSLVSESNYKDSAINAFIAGVNQVETNIKAINEKQAEVSDMSAQHELSKNQFDRINEDITNINALMEANKNELNTLKKKLKGANFKIAELEKSIASLQQQLDSKNADAFNTRGLIQVDKGNVDKAIVDYTEAIQLNPKSVYAYNNRGRAYRRKGEVRPNFAPAVAFAAIDAIYALSSMFNVDVTMTGVTITGDDDALRLELPDGIRYRPGTAVGTHAD